MDNKSNFIQAIRDKKIVRLTFDSKEKGRISRKAIPFDYGLSNRYKNGLHYYQSYDLEGRGGNHNLSVEAANMIDVQVLDESFTPADYVTWAKISWKTPRDWGDYS